VHLDSKFRALSIEEVAKGTATSCLFDPKSILQGAILANAVHLIVAHPHPSGNPDPSPEDITVTRNLKKVMDMLPIKLADHIIIGRTGYFSFGDQGLL
jgi:DNA repair protein RadC